MCINITVLYIIWFLILKNENMYNREMRFVKINIVLANNINNCWIRSEETNMLRKKQNIKRKTYQLPLCYQLKSLIP